MVTDRYLTVRHHADAGSFLAELADAGVVPIGVDNLPGALPLERTELPRRCCLVFGSEGPGLTEDVVAGCSRLVSISQYGSTRSLNAGAAAAIAMNDRSNREPRKPGARRSLAANQADQRTCLLSLSINSA